MIEVNGLTKRFGSIQALRDVSFKVEPGQIVGFLGANGAGKTTTMDIMCGCIGADSGSAKIAGFDIMDQPLEAKRRLGYLPDVAPLHLEMRVADYVTFAARLHKVPAVQLRKQVDDALDRLSLGDVRHRLVGNLSKGYRQRVALAQAIVHNPEVLILDEPTEGLDPNQILHIRELIKSLAGQHTIILSSHILSEVQNTCDRIVIIHNGVVVQQGSVEELARQAEAGRIYRMRVANNVDQLARDLGAINQLSGVRLTDPKNGELEFGLAKAADEQVITEVSKVVVNGSYGLRELTLKTHSLEDVFFQLTH
ncbi:MAG: ABC transporter ATP-binding protein [Deltaproteobacteria bacterium]|nr:ABC transporter ATP-binding protein [Deltaproteobacteria bacterium]